MPKRLTNRSVGARIGLAHDHLVAAMADLAAGDNQGAAASLSLASESLRKAKREIDVRGYGKAEDGSYHADRWSKDYHDQFEAALDNLFPNVWG